MFKLIGIFQEKDGETFSKLEDAINKYKIIGSLSEDVGDIKLYYDNNGNTYAIAHDSEFYYGE